jgi:hypothetical protein
MKANHGSIIFGNAKPDETKEKKVSNEKFLTWLIN